MVWEDFDWEDKVIRIEAKTKATRIIPILPTLNHALKAHGGGHRPRNQRKDSRLRLRHRQESQHKLEEKWNLSLVRDYVEGKISTRVHKD
jgi:integrase